MTQGMNTGQKSKYGEQAIRRAAKRVQTRGDEARRRARALGQARPDLVGWLVLHTRALSDAARGAAWQGFELACEVMGATLLPPVDIARLVAAQADNDELALTIAICHPRFADRYLRHARRLRQRALLCRLAADVAPVPAGERAEIFLVLKTIVDVLDEAR